MRPAHPSPPTPADEGQPLAGVPTAREAANADLLRDRRRLSHVGRYSLKAPLGEGIFGGVYEAWDPLLSRTVAIRTLQFGLKIASRVAVDRLLLDAAREAGELHHRHIVGVLDAGLSAHGVYIVMEHLAGQDMGRAFDGGWRPTVAEAVRLARRVADGLSYAHARGVVHGAVQPGNVFVTRSGRPKLLDVGIARVIDRGPVPELSGVRIAPAAYQAPETLDTGYSDERTDLYSLGILLYEMLAGRRPHRAESIDVLRQSIAQGRHVPLSEWRPDLPSALVQLVESAMAAERDSRPVSAHAMATALRRFSSVEDRASQAAAEARRSAAPSAASGRRRHWAVRWAFPSTTW